MLIAFDDREVTYGGSPGDENHPEPYLYVAPWTAPEPGPQWNAIGFGGAEAPWTDEAAALAFFRAREGRAVPPFSGLLIVVAVAARDHGGVSKVAQGYRRFAEIDAPGRSPLYAELAAGVAGDEEVIRWLDGLPVGKRQPNLLFAAYRLLCGTPAGWPEFRERLRERRGEIEDVMLARRTQTNEPARCALMLPLLAALPQPLALLEVGASAGLCLLPDRYGYDYDDGGHVLDGGAPVLRCATDGDVPFPPARPEVVWRAGLDLEPIDVNDPAKVEWLELLIWPGEEYRLDTLRGALEVARADPPRLVVGDLTTDDLDALAAEAPRDATLVIFHTAVLFYVPRGGRAAFRERVDRLGATWIACEGADVLGYEDERPDLMALARDGERVAWADGHGKTLSWG